MSKEWSCYEEEYKRWLILKILNAVFMCRFELGSIFVITFMKLLN